MEALSLAMSFNRPLDRKSGNSNQKEKLDKTPLSVKIEAVLRIFMAVRGPDCLKNNATAVVMRKNDEWFVTQDVSSAEETDGIAALVYLKDLECYERFRKTIAMVFFEVAP